MSQPAASLLGWGLSEQPVGLRHSPLLWDLGTLSALKSSPGGKQPNKIEKKKAKYVGLKLWKSIPRFTIP